MNGTHPVTGCQDLQWTIPMGHGFPEYLARRRSCHPIDGVLAHSSESAQLGKTPIIEPQRAVATRPQLDLTEVVIGVL